MTPVIDTAAAQNALGAIEDETVNINPVIDTAGAQNALGAIEDETVNINAKLTDESLTGIQSQISYRVFAGAGNGARRARKCILAEAWVPEAVALVGAGASNCRGTGMAATSLHRDEGNGVGRTD